MSEYAPQAIHDLWKAIKKEFPSAELSGILGDKAHTYGYHRARAVLPSTDYSVHYPGDREGDPWAASALDIKFTPADMKLVTKRLREAFAAHDPRVNVLREVGGTLDGRVTFARDRVTGRESWGEWDDTHLWHVHLSILRKWATNAKALLPVAAVIAGVPMTAAQKIQAAGGRATSTVTTRRVPLFTLPKGHYYGLITGPRESHGGINASEQAAVKLIQQRLQALGFAPKVSGWADGRFEAETKAAVVRFQRARKYRVNGIITAAGWTALFK